MPASAAISSIEVAAKPLRANARAAAASTCCTRSALGMRRRPRVPAIQPPTLRYQRDNTYSQVDTEEFTYRRCQRAGGWRRSQVLPPEPIQLVEPAAQLGEPLRAQRVSVTFPGRAPATMAGEQGRWRWRARDEDHGERDRRGPPGQAAPVAGRAGLGAVGACPDRAGDGALVRPPDATGRAARPDPVERQHHPLPAGPGDRADRRSGAGRPAATPPGGMAAAGAGAVGVGVGV